MEEPLLHVRPYQEKRSLRSMCCFLSGGFAISRKDTGGSIYQISYDYFLKTAKTGDILLFEGKGWASCVIQCAEQMRYSHIGMVVRLKEETESGKEHLFIWESTKPDRTYDFLSGTDKDGPRLINAHERIYAYARKNYTVTYRPMKIWDSRVIEQMDSGLTDMYMWATLLLMSRLPYELNYGELANAHLRLMTGIEHPKQSSVFCSELVAYTYRSGMGLSLKDPETGSEWTPHDFTPEDFSESAQGIPFAHNTYSRDGARVIRAAQATYASEYVLASYSHIDPTLATMYRGFLSVGKERLKEMIERAIPGIEDALEAFRPLLKKDEEEQKQGVPPLPLSFVYRTEV